MKSGARAVLTILLALAVAGCGDPDLWARYRAEHDFWHARRQLTAIEIQPKLASPADIDRAAAAFRRVADRFPAAQWTDPAHLGRPIARDVALLGARAAVASVRILELHGDLAASLAGYRKIESDYAALPAAVLDARLARAATLARAGRSDEVTEVQASIARELPAFDAEGEPIAAVLEAPLAVVNHLQANGRTAEADSVLRATEARDLDLLPTLHGGSAAMVWEQLARVRMLAHRTDDALEALRSAALARVGTSDARQAIAGLVLRMASYAIDGGRADSALAYTRWAAAGFDDRTRAEAMSLEARAWETLARPDSALDAWGRFLEAYPAVPELSPRARFQRGRLYEQLGRWEQARSEYRALIASDPTGARSMQSLVRIVAWSARRGEKDLARIEGERGIESLDRLILTNRDETVQRDARTTRAELLVEMEDWARGCPALSDLWNRYGDAGAGLRAAAMAESRLHDPERARLLYRDVADRATQDAERRAAREALARMGRGNQGPS